MMEVCTTTFGAIDGLVANAAIMHMASPWDEDEARLRAIVDVNIIGVQFVAARAMRAMVDSGRGGSVVTIVSGAQFGIIGMSAYGATKGAVTAMTANWSLEGAAHGIRVNAVSPFARTPMSLVHSSDRVGRGEIDEPPRLGNPEDVAPIVVSLLSESTQHITGRTFRFDGQQLSSYATSVESIAQQSSWTAEDITAALTSQAVSAASAD
jgi:NAD(P)-dependent dehydrogenase (short-subunit alcohol dehydrogenase family)